MTIPKPFFMLPFDHRAGFAQKILGYDLANMRPEEIKHVGDLKMLVYQAAVKSLELGVGKNELAILVDEQFGSQILAQAKQDGIYFATCVEKSGQDNFDFEYGSEWQAHLDRVQPSCVKVLVRWHIEHIVDRENQLNKLKALSDYCLSAGRPLLFELLVPAMGEDKAVADFDQKRRPALMVKAIEEFYQAGIKPAIWKIEGLDEAEAFASVSQAARQGHSESVLIVLGRNETDEKVKHWLAVGKQTAGVTGFAVGRTIFLQPLLDFNGGKITAEQAIDSMAKHFADLVTFWRQTG